MRRLVYAVAALAVVITGSMGALRAQPPMPSGQSAPPAATVAPDDLEVATFAAGCFWCVQADFDKVPGVVATMPGYTGGHTPNPTYWDVATETTGHTEALQVTFDPKRVSYAELLQHFWHDVDPVDGSGQFCDRGTAYRPAIFTHDAEQQRLAEESKRKLEQSKRFDRPLAVEIVPASEFTPAEPEHRKYYLTHRYRYIFYRLGCGRDARLRAVWGEEASH